MQERAGFLPEEGQLVAIRYKTGEYVGEWLGKNGPRNLVKVLAVLRHPEQGDLHHPYDPDVPMFHERRALSYTEKVNVQGDDMRPYSGAVPDYRESLASAIATQQAELDKLKRWAERGLAGLEQLKREYR